MFMVIGSNKKKVYQEFWIKLYQNTANKAKKRKMCFKLKLFLLLQKTLS